MKGLMNRKSKGFTLMELLIVIVILGVLAALAIPAYQGSVKRAYRTEALDHIREFRSAAAQYYAKNGMTYDGLTFTTAGYDPNTGAAGSTAHFSYALSNAGGNVYTITATGLANAGTASGSTVIVNQGGTEGSSTLT